MVTPRRDGEVEVDLGAMLDIIDFVTARGVDGLAIFSASGEFLHYTLEERSRFIGLATKRSRVPVLVNVSHSTLDGTILLAEEAAGAGVAGVLAMPPYFFRYGPDEISIFLLELAAQVNKWTAVYIYNVPAFSNCLPVQTALDLLASGQFAGICEASGDPGYLESLSPSRQQSAIRVLCESDPIFAAGGHDHAADAWISPIASAVPEIVVSGKPAASQRLAEFIEWENRFPVPVAIREAARMRGIKTGSSAVPLGERGRRNLEDFRVWFRDWIKVVERECKA